MQVNVVPGFLYVEVERLKRPQHSLMWDSSGPSVYIKDKVTIYCYQHDCLVTHRLPVRFYLLFLCHDDDGE